jgi:hypothetical protein
MMTGGRFQSFLSVNMEPKEDPKDGHCRQVVAIRKCSLRGCIFSRAGNEPGTSKERVS